MDRDHHPDRSSLKRGARTAVAQDMAIEEAIRVGTAAEVEDERILREDPDSAAADAIRYLRAVEAGDED